MIIPILLLDFLVTLYQLVCFPVYGVLAVRRRDHFAFDHGHLAYLNTTGHSMRRRVRQTIMRSVSPRIGNTSAGK